LKADSLAGKEAAAGYFSKNGRWSGAHTWRRPEDGTRPKTAAKKAKIFRI
jgi:hypothetical protein